MRCPTYGDVKEDPGTVVRTYNHMANTGNGENYEKAKTRVG